MVPTSTLAQHHPDHPTLADLGMSDGNTNAATAGPGGIAMASPTQTTTPLSMSDEEIASPESAPRPAPGMLTEGPNARSKTISTADGDDTYGALNCHPAGSTPKSRSKSASTPSSAGSYKASFRVGVSEDRNKKCRRTMEDAHSFVYDYGAVRGQGYFAVFDGHAGKHAAEWCGQNFHEFLLDALISHPEQPVPDLLNKTFHTVDSRLSKLAQAGKTQSGCTAVTAFLRVEHGDDHEGIINPNLKTRGLMEGKGVEELEAQTSLISESEGGSRTSESGSGTLGRKMSGRRIRDFVRGLTGHGNGGNGGGGEEAYIPAQDQGGVVSGGAADGSKVEAIEVGNGDGKSWRRVLYTANVGDARAVLCRGGKAVRLTYDHKGSDHQEAKRITDAGGFVMNNRVNGVLAVTRSLGDASMKEFVVGSPYTTETTLDDQDEFLIVACDGLWDVAEDQIAVDLIRNIQDPQEASKKLLDHAITNYSTDNLSVMVVRFYHK